MASRPLEECVLFHDGLTGDRWLRINGADYSVVPINGGVRLDCRDDSARSWSVVGGSCNCPAAYFHPGPCKHVAAVATGVLSSILEKY